mgnify:CR=1 FL=1
MLFGNNDDKKIVNKYNKGDIVQIRHGVFSGHSGIVETVGNKNEPYKVSLFAGFNRLVDEHNLMIIREKRK